MNQTDLTIADELRGKILTAADTENAVSCYKNFISAASLRNELEDNTPPPTATGLTAMPLDDRSNGVVRRDDSLKEKAPEDGVGTSINALFKELDYLTESLTELDQKTQPVRMLTPESPVGNGSAGDSYLCDVDSRINHARGLVRFQIAHVRQIISEIRL